MLLIAHGGYSAKYPENTLISFQKALEYNPDVIEMDACVMGDETVVCAHPKTIKAEYGLDLSAISYDELVSRIQNTGNEVHPQLYEVMSLARESECKVLLDIKQDDINVISPILNVVKDSGVAFNRIIVGARDDEKMELIIKDYPEIEMLCLYQEPDRFSEFIEKGGKKYRLWEEYVTSERIDSIHQSGGEVWVTPGTRVPRTAGEIAERRLIEFEKMGVDGVLVNDIKMARKVLV